MAVARAPISPLARGLMGAGVRCDVRSACSACTLVRAARDLAGMRSLRLRGVVPSLWPNCGAVGVAVDNQILSHWLSGSGSACCGGSAG